MKLFKMVFLQWVRGLNSLKIIFPNILVASILYGQFSSSANLLMIASLFYSKDKFKKLKRGDEVIVPAVSWSTSYYPLYQYGLKLKFIDIDLETLNYDLKKLKEAVSKKTKLILVVNLLGNPNNFKEIKKIVSSNDVMIIEDNCESLGAEFENKKTGTIGLLGTFSFFSHHILLWKVV